MQRLGSAEHCRERLDGDAHDVVVRLLRGQGATGGLGVEAKHLGFWIFGAETLLHDFCPDAAGGAELGNLFKQVVVGVEEERQARSEFINIHADLDGGVNVGDAVGQGEGDFLHGAGTGFTDMVAGDGDGVPLGHVVFTVGKDVGDDAHGLFGRIDVGAARHVLFEDIVLDRAGDFIGGYALLFSYGNVHAEQDGSGGVDGHGGGNLVQRDAVEKDFHIRQRVNGHADFTDFTETHAGVGVVAHLGRQVKGDGKPGLAGRKQIFIALVGFFGGTETGILAHGPEAAAIHGRLHATGIGVFPRKAELFFIAGIFEIGGEAAFHLYVGACQKRVHPLG